MCPEQTNQQSFQNACVVKLLLLFAMATVVLFGSTVSSSIARGQRIAPEMLQQMLAAQVACDTADNALFDAMTKAANQFTRFCRMRGRYPTTDRDAEQARIELKELVDLNPYAKNPILAQQINSQFPDAHPTCSIVQDETLTENKIRGYIKSPPQEWQATPGSLFLIHNGFDTYMIWGAGIDGKPLHDRDGNVRMIARQVGPWIAL